MSLPSEMRMSLVQMNSTLDREANLDKVCAYIDRTVAEDKPHLVVIPEFFNHHYVFQYRDHKYLDLAEPEDGYSLTRVREKAREHGIHLVATLYEEESAGIYYDTAFVVDPAGEIIGKYRKIMPGLYLSLERMYFRFGSYFPVLQGW